MRGVFYMNLRLGELKDKQVLSIKDASVIGFVSDIEVDTNLGKVTSVIASGKSRGFSLLSRGEDIVIPFEKIEVIGNDSILVNFEGYLPKPKKHKSVLSGLFYGE